MQLYRQNLEHIKPKKVQKARNIIARIALYKSSIVMLVIC